MPTVNPTLIQVALDARSMTQGALSEETPNISQVNISRIINGKLKANHSHIEEIAAALNYPTSFFYQDDIRPSLSNLHYRKQYKVNGKKLANVRAQISIITRAIGALMEEIEVERYFEELRFDFNDGWEPKSAARTTREYLGMPKGPVQNPLSYIEKAAIIVFFTDFGIEGFDGVAAFTDNGYPIVFVDKNKSNDRIILTAWHEVGHITQHIPFMVEPFRDEEKEAYEYATEVLTPSYEIQHDLKNLKYYKLNDLKEYWGVSKAALIRRAYYLGLIEPKTYKYFNIELSRNGERKKEKGYVPIDKPTLMNNILELYRTEKGYTDADLADLTKLSLEDFNNYFKPANNSLKVLKPTFSK